VRIDGGAVVIAKPVPVGSRLFDSLQFSQSGTLAQARKLKSAGFDGGFVYIGVATSSQITVMLVAGLGVIPVTLAGAWTSPFVEQIQAMDFCPGVSVFLDIEGKSLVASEIQPIINARCKELSAAGFIPSGYFGVPQPFPSATMYKLPFEGYWHGQGSIRDFLGDLAEPSGCGWQCYQAWPSQTVEGVLLDYNMVTADYKGRVPSWGVSG
jgi:hypothetical protein